MSELNENESGASEEIELVDREGDGARIDRRSAIRKAAVGGAAAGAVWVAPKVDGLSVVPDYAAAGTDTGVSLDLTFDAAQDDGGQGSGCSNREDFAYFHAPNNPGWTGSGSVRAEGGNPIVRSANLGNAGSVTVTTTNDLSMDGDAEPGAMVLSFNVDPPFNNCRVTSAEAVDCTVFLVDGEDPFSMPVSPAPVPNTSSSFSQTINLPPSGGIEPNNSRLEISITCD